MTPAGVAKVLTPPGTITFGTSLGTITAGPDGNLWFTEPDPAGRNNLIGRVTPAGTFTELSVCDRSEPYAVGAGPDGNIWYGTPTVVGRVTPAGTVTEFSGSLPVQGITTVGQDLWFAETSSVHQDGSLGKVMVP